MTVGFDGPEAKKLGRVVMAQESGCQETPQAPHNSCLSSALGALMDVSESENQGRLSLSGVKYNESISCVLFPKLMGETGNI